MDKQLTLLEGRLERLRFVLAAQAEELVLGGYYEALIECTQKLDEADDSWRDAMGYRLPEGQKHSPKQREYYLAAANKVFLDAEQFFTFALGDWLPELEIA